MNRPWPAGAPANGTTVRSWTGTSPTTTSSSAAGAATTTPPTRGSRVRTRRCASATTELNGRSAGTGSPCRGGTRSCASNATSAPCARKDRRSTTPPMPSASGTSTTTTAAACPAAHAGGASAASCACPATPPAWPAYERLPHVLRDSPRFNTYLSSPPARHPEARPTARDHTSPRDFHSLALDAFFTTTDHPEGNALSP